MLKSTLNLCSRVVLACIFSKTPTITKFLFFFWQITKFHAMLKNSLNSDRRPGWAWTVGHRSLCRTTQALAWPMVYGPVHLRFPWSCTRVLLGKLGCTIKRTQLWGCTIKRTLLCSIPSKYCIHLNLSTTVKSLLDRTYIPLPLHISHHITDQRDLQIN